MDNNNQENLQNVVQPTDEVVAQETPVEEAQDPRLIHPVIIGELRKEKIGKPVMVIELFLLFGIVFAALPFIHNMLNDENSMLYRLIHPDQVINEPIIVDNPSTPEEFLDGSQINNLNTDQKIKFKNVVLRDISLSEGTVKCTISSYSGVINLDEQEYYMDVSSQSGNVIAHVKLTGTIDNVEKQVKLEASGVQFNNSLSYQGLIKEMKDSDYPNVQLTGVDERGYGSLVCKKGNRVITYGFRNNYLVSINDTSKVITSEHSGDEYINLLTLAKKKAEGLGVQASNVEEVEDGFVFTSNIQYESGYTIPNTVIDYDYYKQDTLVNKIDYAQKGKGFDCK